MSTSTLPVTKKRKGKAELVSPGNDAIPPAVGASSEAANGESHTESIYIRELTKNIRNINKKLAASAKADSVVAENPDVSLDDLVEARKLNTDQKAQILKKPALQAQLAAAEEQLSNFRAFAQEIEERVARERAVLVEAHEAEVAAVKESTPPQDDTTSAEAVEDALRTVSLFLHAAASKRQAEDTDSDEARAFEGALLLVYQGNEASVTTLKNLVAGSNEQVTDIQGESINFTFAQIVEVAKADIQVSQLSEQTIDEAQPSGLYTKTEAQTDPTVANAGMTELDDTTAVNTDTTAGDGIAAVAEQASTADDAANAIAESSWDPQASVVTESSAANEDWVQVPRDPGETDNGVTATPAAPQTNSWAEEVAGAPEQKSVPENDGFEQVRRERGRGRGHGRGRGEFRGRGRGQRGDGFRGRGRDGGAPRGGRGAPRGEKS